MIGGRRWDRLPGHELAGLGPGLDPPAGPALGVGLKRAHLVGTATLHGRPVWKVAFFDPQIQAWFTIWVDGRPRVPWSCG